MSHPLTRGFAWLSVLSIGLAAMAADPAPIKFQKRVLSTEFLCEGAYFGDFNRDGKMDVVAGPFWFEGPDLNVKHEIHTPKSYDPKAYSENFLAYTGDFNGDGWIDVLVLPHPGQPAYWYENPAGKDQPWKKHLAHPNAGNESPMWGDIDGDGRNDLVFNKDGFLGYATYDPAKPDEPWLFHAVSGENKRYQKYTHGVGFGDINGDGRVDLIEAIGWWEHPEKPIAGQPWTFHAFRFAEAAAQILVYDVDGDGLNDVITSWQCHKYGLLWYKQTRSADGQIGWDKNVIFSPEPDLKSDDLRISQLHALDLVDINGDGLKDIVTGKRYWAHGPKGDVEPDAPAVVYWFELRREGGNARFIPHLVDNDSGVGTQVTAADINGDKILDVIVGNKKGVFVHLSAK